MTYLLIRYIKSKLITGWLPDTLVLGGGSDYRQW